MVGNFLRTFFPWFIYFLITKLFLVPLLLGLFTALSLFLVLNWQSLLKGFGLPWTILAFFAFIFSNVFFLKIPLPSFLASSLFYACLASFAFISIVLKKPFTMRYAMLNVPAAFWTTALFKKTNQILSFIWGIIFSANTILNLIMGHYLDAFWLQYALSVLFVLAGILTSKYFPRWYTKAKTSSLTR